MARAVRGPQTDSSKMVSSWNKLSDAEKLRILPSIMDSTPEWRIWAFSDVGLVTWLKWKFERARLPFPL